MATRTAAQLAQAGEFGLVPIGLAYERKLIADDVFQVTLSAMLISETVYRHQVEADIRPFRDILLGLFFVTVGMMLDLGFVLSNIDRLVLAVLLLVGGKGLVVLIVWEAWSRLQAPPPVRAGGMLGVAVAGLAVNVFVAVRLHEHQQRSLNLRGAYLHVLSDLLGSIGAIVPSTPMFQSPAVKVINRPATVIRSGIQATSTSENLSNEPTEPTMIFL